ncbi:MAG TPA: polysaccharide biosynthesis C-terminal domain-containing protein [Bacteroidales bacterium]|nr:polysaccharide biosynthesis C-terminal domain-containing protein [Bacteroidales bacterium]
MASLLNSIRQTSKDTFVYGMGNIAVKVIGFILIPLYTNPEYFSVDEFGIIAVLDITGLIMISVMASGLPQSLMRWYWDKKHKNNQKGIFFMSLMIQLLVSILFCLFFLPLTDRLSIIIFSDIQWSGTLRLLILASALQSINNIINTLMRLQSKSLLFTVTNLSKLLIVLLLTVYLIVFRHSGVKGIYMAQFIGNGLLIFLVLIYTIRNCKVFFNFPILRSMSKYGLPIMLANFAAAALTVIDRYSLNSLAILKYVAIYTLAYKISSVLKLVIVDSIKMALTPLALRKMDSPDNKRFYSKAFLYSSFVLMTGIIVISLFSFEVIKFITGSREYWESFYLVPLLSLSVFFINMRETSSYALIITKKTKIIGINVVIACVINIVLNLLLIPRWDITGAAVATIITQFIYWFLNFYFSQKELYIPYELKKIMTLFFTGGLIAFSGLLMTEIPFFPRFIIKAGCIAGFPFLLYLFGFYEPVELQAIRAFTLKWIKIKNFRKNLQSLKDFKDLE